ncbi:PHB depolymerase family esterase [Cereibacter sphaeroides]|uniref:extracellular catalytic domain type 1 short-chain-length polyhydroxyalkanoate depolymerase n=1 Tax=Cereibacter sphaeroides TaxID=1063 RepID=UPI001F234067|nr:PHB depolymerase family esterase [Cereibacter sphaeroides]MCE6951332.1 PHB depolymerase family esterase [Cereibacter sphaeroides]
MKIDFATAMGRALEQIRAGQPGEATRTIQSALAPRADAAPERPAARHAAPTASDRQVEDAEILEDRPHPRPAPAPRPAVPRRGLREVVDALSRLKPASPRQPRGPAQRPATVEGSRYERRSFSCRHGARDYMLYVPSALPEGPQGLVVMLHGCTQDPDDFAAGTNMNAHAERHGLIVAYPHQTRNHNAQGCWNWFRPGDQEAGQGEPALLSGLAREVAAEFSIGTERVFVAGLSAGGAMAATLGAAHPDVFAAVGIHSGLPPRAAQDVVSAFAAMRGETAGRRPSAIPVRTIVFHGLADGTVHPSNADAILAATRAEGSRNLDSGRTPAGRSYTRETVSSSTGRVLTEIWRVDGAGHAWAGGHPAGSYTDPAGPDASAELVRFFLERA